MVRNAKPKFRNAVLWGACARCGARVLYSTLARERLTGLLMCTKASGRPVNPCWDPWPPFYDFQVLPDRSLDAPPEPMPARWNLDAIWGSGPASGTTITFANAPAAAPDDATRLAKLLTTVPYYQNIGKSAAFLGPDAPLSVKVQSITTFIPADYDGTFLPSNSIRTVVPPSAAAELDAITKTDPDEPQDKIWTLPWSAVKQV